MRFPRHATSLPFINIPILCVQRDAANRSPYRQLGSITSGTIVTEKTLINSIQPHHGMDGMDAISSSRHKPPLYQHTRPGAFATHRDESWAFMMTATSVEIYLKSDASLAVSRSQARRT